MEGHTDIMINSKLLIRLIKHKSAIMESIKTMIERIQAHLMLFNILKGIS